MSNDSGFPPPPPPPDDGGRAPSSNQPASAFESVTNFLDQSISANVRPASAGVRFWAAILDGLLMLVTLFVGWVIWSIFAWQKGQTPAKQLMGLKVVHARTGQTASFGQMLLREVVVKILLGSFTQGLSGLIGAAMVLRPNRQALWDMVASTAVISTR